MPELSLPMPVATRLPDPPPGMFDVAYAVLERGGLALLRSDCDVLGNLARNRAKQDFSQPLLSEGALGRLSIFDGAVESSTIKFPLESAALSLDRLADGCWIVVSGRCEVGGTNARLLSPRGELLNRFCLGDGIRH